MLAKVSRAGALTSLIAVVAAVAVVATLGLVGRSAEASGTILIDASPDTDTNLVGTDHTVTALVTDNGTPAADWEVEFDVLTGPNAGDSDSGFTDVNGELGFTYTGDGGVGQDEIEVCVVQLIPGAAGVGQPIDCETVTKDWVDPTATPTPTPAPSATPTATPVATAPAAELPDTGSAPGGGGIPWAGALALALGGVALLAGGVALSRRAR
ncbi:MAG: hypothetical protein WD379_05360 [Dehalococcoidia bacterium]